ncbi:ABC transporter ATP-binding protein [Zavarzinella formosa]|uniref:ABC transporter ATP-binding protein n=1 Tax=Zavarzinella formosa TaxID=360055 RepID=UPI000307C2F2|nr:ABC transporter ATP-binding protein [Zavarzinella formosa]
MKSSIHVEGLSKCYSLNQRGVMDRNLTENIKYQLGRVAGKFTGRKYESGKTTDYWALKDVSFEAFPGDCIGFVGRNGAGKSTLLKILSRIVEPTAGRATIRGRLGCLLEVGTGFHPELSGRENIFLNGSILGMTRREIKAKFDEIIAFADLDKFLDTPVKRYSSGMFVRLAFAVAAHLQPEVLIVDEVLAVGDASFQKKCLGKMRDVSQEGRTVLFVSHDMTAMRRLCNRAVLMSKGQVSMVGPTGDIVSEYLARESVLTPAGMTVDLTNARRKGNMEARFTSMVFDGAGMSDRNEVISGGPVRLKLNINAEKPVMTDSIAVSFSDRTGYKLVNADSLRLDRPVHLRAGDNEIEVRLRALNLQPGTYTLGLTLARWPETTYDSIEPACDIEVAPNPADGTTRSPIEGVVRCEFDLLGVPESLPFAGV